MPILSPRITDIQSSNSSCANLPYQVNTSPQIVLSTLALTMNELNRGLRKLKLIKKYDLALEFLFQDNYFSRKRFVQRLDFVTSF